MKILKHIFQQPFVTATGAAALVHSTWALGTLFAGEQPVGGWALIGWLAPALLIAFALDVGQIVTSAEIRQNGLTWTRGFTFVVFAGATYYLQWLYIAHHMPALAIAAGVSDVARQTVVSMRDAALWIIPALLPLSTLLYTFSGGQKTTLQAPTALEAREPLISKELLKPQVLEGDKLLPENTPEIVEKNGQFVARYGEWERSYSTLTSAQRGLGGYKAQMNKVAASHFVTPEGRTDSTNQPVFSSNGHSIIEERN